MPHFHSGITGLARRPLQMPPANARFGAWFTPTGATPRRPSGLRRAAPWYHGAARREGGTDRGGGGVPVRASRSCFRKAITQSFHVLCVCVCIESKLHLVKRLWGSNPNTSTTNDAIMSFIRLLL